MHITTSFAGSATRPSKRRLAAAAAAIALTATAAATVVGSHTSAVEEGGGSPAPAGEQVSDIPTGVEFEAAPESNGDELIVVSGSTFDDTILTKYVAASSFQVAQGDAADFTDDTSDVRFGACVSPGADSTGSVTDFRAGVELPDGARIKRVHFYGLDNDPVRDIDIELDRVQYDTPLVFLPFTPVSTRTTAVVDSFSTTGQQAEASVFSGADALDEITGSFNTGAIALTGSANRFHTIYAELWNSAGALHQLCGVRVDYQVPASTVVAGDQYHPVGPIRAFDSREASFSESGLLAPDTSKVIDITDGYDLDGNAVPAQADSVPATATAITYNITVTGVTGANFTSVTAGDATAFTTSAINFGSGDELANAGTVTISNGEIKLWGGSNVGSTHVVIDVTGYYAPGPLPSNMGN